MTDRYSEIEHERLRARLIAISEDHAQIVEHGAEIRQERAEAIRKAYSVGLGVSEIARLAKLSRQAIYDVLDE